MPLQVHSAVACLTLLAFSSAGAINQPDDQENPGAEVVQGTLISPGSTPFHLKATFTEGRDTTPVGTVEMFWLSPDKWRRVIQSDDFSQMLVVNGREVFEQDSDDYFPIRLQTLVTAIVDPKPTIDALRLGDRIQTKANGASDEDGLVCFDDKRRMCLRFSTGLTESLGAAGHSVQFTDYRKFRGKRIARILTDTVSPGDSLHAQVTELDELKNPDQSLFSISRPTPREKQLRTVLVPETELRSQAVEMHEIIWPQVLDGRTKGTATFYVSVDVNGKVREILPVKTDNERSNDSARLQIMKWKFNPIVKEGYPVQAESIFSFVLDTRAWGPPVPLSDEEARKLATNIVEPVIPPGTAQSGATVEVLVAIDAAGNLIEAIPGEGPPGLFSICYQAVAKWHFSPILQDGQPRPYRAAIKFQVP
jgi:hypothetical protein